jgi:protein tyrosine kinase modulator
MNEARTARDRLDRMLSVAGRAARFWLAAAAVIVVGGMISGAVAFTRPRIYKSETLILYREGIRSADLGGPDGVADPARKLGLKLKEMVLSRTRLSQIIDEFHLYPALVGERGYVDAVDEMRGHIAFRVKDGDTFGLSFEGEDRDVVQQVTARLAEALISENSKTRAEQAEVTRSFLDAEKKRADAELRERETALARFLAKHPEFAKETSASPSAMHTTPGARAKTTDPALLALEREATRIQERLGMPVAKKRERDIDPKLAAEKQAAEADVRVAQKELESKLQQFTEAHPDVKLAKARLKTANERLRQATDALAQSDASAAKDEAPVDRGALEAELRRVNEEIAALKRKKSDGGAQPGSAQWIVALETDWSRLSREVSEARERTQQLQDKQFKAKVAESAATSERNAQMEIIDEAYKPTHPARPGRAVIAAAGLGVSVALALLLALGLALVDDRLYDRWDVERAGVVPLVGVVPREKGRRHG